MRLRHIFYGLLIGFLCVPSAAWSIELVEMGTKTPIRGYVVREDAKKIKVRVVGKDDFKEFERSKITIIHQLNQKVLEGLSKDNPKAYLAYAEELAKKTTDPEAKETALRLYLIVAHLDSQQSATCLLKMSALATGAEARKYRALAFLLDPAADASTLKKEAAKPVQAIPENKAQIVALTNFQQALRSYRNGQPLDAKEAASREGVDKYFGLAPGMIDKKSFIQICINSGCVTCKLRKFVTCPSCKGAGQFNDFGFIDPCTTCNRTGRIKCSACDGTGVGHAPEDQLRTIIQAELWAVEQLAGAESAPKKGGDDAKWSAILQARQLNPVPVLNLDTISDFNPRECFYRNGKWVTTP